MQDNQNVAPFTPEQIEWLENNLKLSIQMECLGIGMPAFRYIKLKLQDKVITKVLVK
jgi:hypothetical protein